MMMYMEKECLTQRVNTVVQSRIVPKWFDQVDQIEVVTVKYGVVTLRVKMKDSKASKNFNTNAFNGAILKDLKADLSEIETLVVLH